MKTALWLLGCLVSTAHSFGVPPAQCRIDTKLAAEIPEDMMTDEHKEIKRVQSKWNEIRHLDRGEAERTLEGEWLEAYNRFYEQYDEDMKWMKGISKLLEDSIEEPKVTKKTKGQRKRDAYARRLARDAAHGVV